MLLQTCMSNPQIHEGSVMQSLNCQSRISTLPKNLEICWVTLGIMPHSLPNLSVVWMKWRMRMERRMMWTTLTPHGEERINRWINRQLVPMKREVLPCNASLSSPFGGSVPTQFSCVHEGHDSKTEMLNSEAVYCYRPDAMAVPQENTLGLMPCS